VRPTEAATGSEDSSAPLVLWLLPLFGSVPIPGLWWTSADRPFAFLPDLITHGSVSTMLNLD
jgi:hypothetical protein